MIFLTNEGNEPIETEASIDGCTTLVAVDLWSGRVWREESRICSGKTCFELKLGFRESLLLILDDTGAFPAEPAPVRRFADVEFTLVSDDKEKFVKCYRGIWKADVTETEEVWLRVRGEEMVECFVNGNFAGFSLWNPHAFAISRYCVPGENEILLKVTGNAANRFTDHRIPYGLFL